MELQAMPPQVRPSRRVGRGSASGRGTKGQKARSGGNIRPGFEGGQMPLHMRTGKSRGFQSRRPHPKIFNLSDFRALASGTTVDMSYLLKTGKITTLKQPVKLLGGGEIPPGVIFDLPMSDSVATKLGQKTASKRQNTKDPAPPEAAPSPKSKAQQG